MTTPKRIRLSRATGWRKPAGAIVVARPGPWGNPFVVSTHGTRAWCVHKFALLAGGYICISDRKIEVPPLKGYLKWLRAHLPDLAGHDLACWCPLDAPCHADVLLTLANNPHDGCLDRFLLHPIKNICGPDHHHENA